MLSDAKRPVIYHTLSEDLGVCPRAGLGLRTYAAALDLAFTLPILGLLKLPFNAKLERLVTVGFDQEAFGILLFLVLFTTLIYYVGPTAVTGQTLGKSIVGLRVVTKEHRDRLPFFDVLVRETVGKLLSAVILFTGFFVVGIDPGRRALHDRMARTVVIDCRGA